MEFNRRKDYIDSLNIALAPIRGFDSIEYARAYMRDKEYVKLSDIIGNVLLFDISDLTLAQVLKDIAKCLLADEIKDPAIVPTSIIQDPDERLAVAELFR